MINPNKIWYQKHWLATLLLPLSVLYRFIIFLRRLCYQWDILKIHQFAVPVVVVGNLTVGGTGKTPLLIALVRLLKKREYFPGVITRGYGGENKSWPCCVTQNSDPRLVGDEAVLIARNTKVPVFAGPDRVDSVKQLLQAHPQCNVILSDDGLQHLRLSRDIEIVVVDGARRFGNGYCLPAGPLREPISRLKTVDFIVSNGGALADEFDIHFVADQLYRVCDFKTNIAVAQIQHKKIIAIAGIGNPDRFFQSLRALGLQFDTCIFSDHHAYLDSDIVFNDYDIVIMTEKDAIKCRSFSEDRHLYLKGYAKLDLEFENAVLAAPALTLGF